MRRLRVVVSMGLQGCRIETETEVEDNATADEINEAVRDAALEHVEWWWEEASAPRRKARP